VLQNKSPHRCTSFILILILILIEERGEEERGEGREERSGYPIEQY
jgi:hypothetical protein